ncbi:MAG: Ig-like domain-containing protein [Bacteroidota bacterium]
MNKTSTLFQFVARLALGCVFLLSLGQQAVAQTTLTYGDIALVGLNNRTSPAQLAWTPLVDLLPNTVIRFSIAGFNGSSVCTTAANARMASGILVWQNNTGATINKGTVVMMYKDGSSGVYTASQGACSAQTGGGGSGNLAQSSSGERLFIYYGGNSTAGSASTDFSWTTAASAATLGAGATPISMWVFPGTGGTSGWLTTGTPGNFTSYRPSDLVGYSMHLGSSAIGGYYNGSRTLTTKAAYLTAMTNTANWVTVSGFDSVTIPTTALTFGTTPSFTGGTTLAVCQNASATSINANLAITDAAASGAATETWTVTSSPSHGSLSGFPYSTSSTGGAVTPSGLTYTPTAGYSGSDAFTIQVSNGTSTASQTVNVTVSPLPTVPAIAGTANVCPTATTTLTNSTSGGTWTSANTAQATIGSTTGIVTGVAAGTALISYQVTNSCGTTTVTKIVTVNALPSAGTLTGTNQWCATASQVLTRSGDVGGTWSSSNTLVGTIAVVTGATATIGGVSPGGTATISYTVSNSCGTSTATRPITVNALSNAGPISGASTVCVGGTSTYTASTTTTGSPYSQTWAVGTATLIATVGSTTGVVTGVSAGTVLLSYSVSGCGTARTTKVVTVNAASSTATISGTATVCPTATTTLSSTVSGGTWTSANTAQATINASSGVVTGVAAGTALISYQFTDGCGVGTTTQVVTINPLPSAGAITGTATVCVSGTTTLGNSTSGGTWLSANLPQATIHPVSGVVTGVASGTATISYQVGNSCGVVTVTTIVTVSAIPSAPAIGGTATLCPAATTTLTNSTSGGTWSSSNTPVATIDAATGIVSGISAGTAVISYDIIEASCSARSTRIVTVNALPAISAGTATSVCIGSSATLSATGGTSYSWSPAASLSSSAGASVVATPTVTTIYTITGTDANGCVNTGNKTVTVNDYPVVPAITGNTTLSTAITTLLSDANTGGAWASANTAVANVNSATGVVSGVAVGNTAISYTKTTSGCATTVTTTVSVIAAENALRFNGTNNYVSIPHSASLNPVSNKITLEAWVNMSDNNNKIIIHKWSPSQYSLESYLNKLTFVIYSGTSVIFVQSSTNFPLNTWVHCVGVYDGTTLSVYENGVLKGTSTPTAGTVMNTATSGDMNLGRRTDGASQYLPGMLDEVRIWNTARTQAEILANMNCDVPQQTGLVAYYRFNEGMAGGTNTGRAYVTDYSGNGNCGTLNAFTLTGTASNYVTGAVGTCNTIATASPAAIAGTLSICGTGTTSLSNSVSGGTWSASTGNVTINSGGVVTGVSTGSAIITYRLGCNIATTVVNVYAIPSVSVAASGPVTFCSGDTVRLTANGAAGNALQLNGSNQGVAITTGAAVSNLGLSSAAFTLEAWVNYTNSTVVAQSIIRKGGDYNLYIYNNNLYAEVWPSGGAAGWKKIIGSVSLTPNTWIHVAATWNGSTCNLVVNGVADASPAVVSMSATSSDAYLALGYSQFFSNYFTGKIDEVRIWNTARTTSAISADMSQGVLPSSAGLVAYYKLDETSGTTVVNAVGNGNNGTLVNSPTRLASTAPMNFNSYAWAPGGATTSAITASATGNYSVTVASGSGCSATSSATSVTANPVPAAISGASAVCSTATTTLSNTVAGGTWGSSNTSVATINVSGVVSGMLTGTTVITYTLPAGCYKTKVLSVNPMPAITGTAVVCEGATTALAGTIAGGAWSSMTTSVATVDAAGLISGVAAGNAVISYILPTGCGASVLATVNATPSITGTAAVCEGSTLTMSASISGGTWSAAGSTTATISAEGVLSGLVAGTLPVTYTLPTGCYAIRTSTVNPLPAAITGTTDICAGAVTTLTNTSTGGSWSSSNTANVAINASSGIATGYDEGGATITYTLPTGCYITTSVINQVAAIAGANAMCIGLTGSLTDATAGGIWSSSNTSLATITADGVVTSITGGVVTITYTVGSCYRTLDINISTTPAPISGSGTLCVGTTVSLTNGSTGGTWSGPATTTISGPSGTGAITGLTAGTAMVSYALSATCYITTVVTVNALPASVTGVFKACVGAATTLANTTADGIWSSSSPATASVDTAGVVTGVSAGTALISYTNSDGCSRSAIVTINAIPSSSTGPGSVCVGVSVMLANSTAGGVSWTSSNTSVATVNSSTGTVTGVSAGNADITFTVGTGCFTTSNITVNALPATIGGTLKACVGLTSSLSNTTTGGTWASSNSVVAAVDMSTGVVTGNAVGNATITYTAGGCIKTAVFTVTATPPAIAGYATACVGTATTLTSGGGGTWSSSDVAIATVGSGTGVVSGVAPGNATITYMYTTGCFATREVTVNTAPGAITGTAALCAGTTTTLANSLSGGVWSAANPAAATIGSASGIVTGVGAGTTMVTYAFGAGCRATRAVTVSVAPAIVGTASVCEGSTTALGNSSAGGTWLSSDAAIASVGTSGIVTGVAAGTASVTYTTAIGCTATRVVTVGTAPAAITGTASICKGATSTLSNATAGGTWTSSGTAIATIGSATGIVATLAVGTANISYTIAGGCRATRIVTVNASGTISGSAALCIGSSATLAASVTGGTWSSSNTAMATIGSATGILTGVAAGNPVISYTTPSGCPATIVATVNSNPSAIAGATSICVGSSVTLTNASSGGTWNSPANPAISGPSATGVLTGLAAGTATISYTLPGNCRSTLSVTVNPLPGTVNGTKKVCETATTMLTTASTGGTWSSATPGIAAIGSATGVAIGLAPGTATISYTVPTGCARTATVTVNANPAPIAGTFTVCASAATTLTSATTGGLAWSSSNTSVATVTAGGGVVNGVAAGNATITYILGTGCFTTQAVTVDACSRPAAPTATVAASNGIRLYPNPTTGAITIETAAAGTMQLYSLDGKLVTTYTVSPGATPLTLPSGLAAAVYMCRWSDNSGNTTIVRLVYEP